MAGARHLGRQRGAALILVIWTFAVLTALAGEFARAMREDAQSTSNFKQETIAYYVAIAAMNEALLGILEFNGELRREGENVVQGGRRASRAEEEKDPREELMATLLLGNGTWVAGEFAGVAYELRVFEEEGKVSLNAADQPLLMRIMDNLGYAEVVAGTVADSIIDWRDEDSNHGINGAEDHHYQSLSRPYESKDAPFDSVEELLLVHGVTREMFYGAGGTPGLREIFYPGAKKQRISMHAMSDAVRHALCGADEEDDDEQSDLFGAGDAQDDTDIGTCLKEAGVGVGQGQDDTKPQLLTGTIEVRVKDEFDRVLTRIGTTVNFRGDPKAMRWSDAIFTDEG